MREGVLLGGGGWGVDMVLGAVKLAKYPNMNFTSKVRPFWLVLTTSKGLVEG